MIIAIDGPAASGKGTLARRLAAELRLAHLDTGLLYRAVGAKLLEAGLDPEDPDAAAEAARALEPADLVREGLRGQVVAGAASKVAAIPAVRAALLAFQRRFAEYPPEGTRGAVLDGRDIGTVVCPGAPVKLFVIARAETRAMRRHRELLERGEDSIYEAVLKETQDRDARDRARRASPLRPAADAVTLDTDTLTPEEAFQAALDIVRERYPGYA